jgi:hypothetical protein
MARSLGQLEARCVGKFVMTLAYPDYPSHDGIQHMTRQDLRGQLQGAHANVGDGTQ